VRRFRATPRQLKALPCHSKLRSTSKLKHWIDLIPQPDRKIFPMPAGFFNIFASVAFSLLMQMQLADVSKQS